ncbi:hypothetical protein DPMN_049717 [Dreissena polymorpha]|uniref:Uncharacterized protein n=1 Tax=Dreissena polymorpha TaxID=45954 RepID=A0A9D4CEU3_DREPO|nr:hypothetical protein DPMN_049717 [Dreissena polymorpha]
MSSPYWRTLVMAVVWGRNIDVDQFVEVMDAYIPGFGDIDSVAVCDWMFELASKMSQGTAPEPTSPTVTSDLPMTSDLVQGACSRLEPETRASRCRNAGSAGDSERSSSESSSEDIDAQVDQLSELSQTQCGWSWNIVCGGREVILKGRFNLSSLDTRLGLLSHRTRSQRSKDLRQSVSWMIRRQRKC